MRNIFDKPAIRRPSLGTPPSYLLETEPTFLRTAHKVKTVENALINEKKNFQAFVDDYYLTFNRALSDFKIDIDEIKDLQYIDEVVLKKMEEMKALRDDLINFFEVIFTYSAQFDIDKFISFLERLLEFLHNADGPTHSSNSLGYLSLDHYRFIYYELFLYMVAIMIRKEKFNELGYILHNSFVLFDQTTKKAETYTFELFNQYAKSLDKYRNDRLQMKRLSLTADLIKQRADNPNYAFEKLLECDVLLYYIEIMKDKVQANWNLHGWFPQTAVYYINSLPILEKLVSMRHFEKIKPLFDVHTINELKQKIEKVAAINDDKLPRINYRYPYITYAFDFTKIGTVK